MAAGAERVGLEEQVNIIAAVEQGRVQTGDARAAENHRLRPVGRRDGRAERQIGGVEEAGDAAGVACAGLLEPHDQWPAAAAPGISPFHAGEIVEEGAEAGR
jgi:hypothetical protein